MKIVEVTRTISGSNYSNISAKALLEDGDTIEAVALNLDKQLRNSILSVETNERIHCEKQREAVDTVSVLNEALAYAKKRSMLPF